MKKNENYFWKRRNENTNNIYQKQVDISYSLCVKYVLQISTHSFQVKNEKEQEKTKSKLPSTNTRDENHPRVSYET